MPAHLNEPELIQQAYLKWGQKFTHHLSGNFLAAIWDEQHKKLLIANDRDAMRPCFYHQSACGTLTISTDFNWICQKIKQLSINAERFIQFATDRSPGTQTCYREIQKMPRGHLLIATQKNIKLKQYWKPSDWKRPIRYKNRSEYYEHFADIFTGVINEGMENKSNIITQLSGGLDSSAVTCLAAKHLQSAGKTLHCFTALPNKLNGNSYRKGWKYHEINLINDICSNHPNLSPESYYSNPKTDPLQTLSHYFDIIDQPIRNPFNFDWIIGHIKHAQQLGCELSLNGFAGNGSISWRGHGLSHQARRLVKKILRRDTITQPIVTSLTYKLAKNYSEQYSNPQHLLMLNSAKSMRISATKAIEQHHNLLTFDPTDSDPIKEFCFNIPQWAYHSGKAITQRRLLVREGLSHLIPSSICTNTFRGEQAADWHLQYNIHIHKWQHRLLELSPDTQHVLWKIYNKQVAFDTIKHHPKITTPDITTTKAVRFQLMRCLSAAFFLEHIISKPNVSVAS